MSKLNKDIIYLIFKELQYDKKTLQSCLSVNKIWCEIIIPILWKDPWKYLGKGNDKLLLNVIFSHLSKESRDYLSRRLNFFTNSYQKPLFDYISFCKHLNFIEIKKLINNTINEKSEIPNIEKEILYLFINKKNTSFTHLYIPHKFNYQINLIPGAERCFSDIDYLSCNVTVNDEVLTGLTKICKSIKELDLFIEVHSNNYEIVKLIKTPKKLLNIRLMTDYYSEIDESFYKVLENSLILHSNHVQYFKITKQPITEILSSFVNLKKLELDDNFRHMTWKCLENLSLPYLQILKAKRVPINVLSSLIENTSGTLTEITIDYVSHDGINNKRIIQAIYKNCPKLKYLKLVIRCCNISELEKLLINCKCLEGLYILVDNMPDGYGSEFSDSVIDWNFLFEILANSSPIGLFKFKLYYKVAPKLEFVKSFFDKWKGRHPMLLQTIPIPFIGNQDTCKYYFDLIEKYKAEGIIKKYDHDVYEYTFEDFEWIQKRFN
ncbi:hypothetical protein RclHR1_01810006 [Rhizophagus clarus]|uniref:F-box domain-containing protein n=1 Tax=Rhizophagus clarus TaxID=94130 RepID=A0A2Z6QLC6_9GLOM|nr:hypothetical protein RclHR1_01810006 [Rhizophagus clarus]GES75224.1 hypothetical protein GLOIN_2v1867019 [Rhizophagus clarus]